ncbi:MAG: alpha/beta fold hydrolase [Anaerolineales bacterium]
MSLHPRIELSIIDIHPERPQGTLVFLHGFGGQATQWIYQLRAFSDSNHVLAIDQRGHGQSDKAGLDYSPDSLEADILAVLDTLGITEPITLVGHSFGGAVAVQFAANYPKRVSKLVLIATAGEFHLNPVYRALLKLPATTLQALAPFTRNWLGAPPHILKALYDQSLSKWDSWNLFRSLKIPTLVIRGHQDRVFETPMFEEVARAIPLAEEVDVGASGHMVMLERREAVNRAISRFLETPTRSWRQTEIPAPAAERAELVSERPWLPYYDEGVPHTIAVPNIPLDTLLQSAVQRFPNRTALIFGGSRQTYHKLQREVNRFANALLSLGLQKGERVMLLLPNLPQMVIAFYATLKAGGVAVFTLPTTEVDELVRQVNHSGSTILVTLTQFDELIYRLKSQIGEGETTSLKHVVFTHLVDYLPFYRRLLFGLSPSRRQRHLLDIPMQADMHVFKQLMRSSRPEPPEVQVAAKDLAAIVYTGGTTDLPKGVMLSHYNLVANTLQTRHWIPDAEEGNERFLCVLPFSHSYGLTTALNVPISIGATLILKPRFDVFDLLKTIKRYKPTIFPGVPRMYMAIKDFPGVRKYGISSIKACISGSAPLPVEVQEAFEKLTRGRLVEGYGLTEASPVTHGNPLSGLRKIGSIGIPFPNTEARIVDLRQGKRSVPQGQIGELSVRGPQVMIGYWQQPAETKRVLHADGWLLTGDVAQMDADGYFRIVARKADMWYPARKKEPVFPRDVEEVLYEIPQVKETAVIHIAGQPIAFVIAAKERPSAESVVDYCKRRLPPELVPRLVVFVEEFPRTFIGKVLRRELARRFELTYPADGESSETAQSVQAQE